MCSTLVAVFVVTSDFNKICLCSISLLRARIWTPEIKIRLSSVILCRMSMLVVPYRVTVLSVLLLLFSFQHSGGLSNFLYYCALPSSLKPNQGEPSRVLVRFYGQIHGEGALEALLTESVIFTLLSERRLGPKLHGVFPGGRLEEFIPVRCFSRCPRSVF